MLLLSLRNSSSSKDMHVDHVHTILFMWFQQKIFVIFSRVRILRILHPRNKPKSSICYKTQILIIIFNHYLAIWKTKAGTIIFQEKSAYCFLKGTSFGENGVEEALFSHITAVGEFCLISQVRLIN